MSVDTKGLPLIGRGTFSKVYQKNSKKVIIVSEDPVKEALSTGWIDSSYMVPKLEQVEYGVYEGLLYEKVTAPKKQLNEKDYKRYKTLRDIFKNTLVTSYYPLHKTFSTLEDPYLKRILLSFLDTLANWGQDIGFEISPRNIATNKKGDLILLDIFFFRSKLREVEKRKNS